jgi:hypothetical protein
MFDTQTPEQAEQELERLFGYFEHRSRANPEFGSSGLRRILYFNEPERIGLLVGAVQILCAEVEDLRGQLEAERVGKNTIRASRPSVEKRPSLSSRLGLDRTPVKVKAPEPVMKAPEPDPGPLPESVRIPGEGSRLVVGSRVVFLNDLEKRNTAVVKGFQRGRNGVEVIVQFGDELPRGIPPESLRPAIPLPPSRDRKVS